MKSTLFTKTLEYRNIYWIIQLQQTLEWRGGSVHCQLILTGNTRLSVSQRNFHSWEWNLCNRAVKTEWNITEIPALTSGIYRTTRGHALRSACCLTRTSPIDQIALMKVATAHKVFIIMTFMKCKTWTTVELNLDALRGVSRENIKPKDSKKHHLPPFTLILLNTETATDNQDEVFKPTWVSAFLNISEPNKTRWNMRLLQFPRLEGAPGLNGMTARSGAVQKTTPAWLGKIIIKIKI